MQTKKQDDAQKASLDQGPVRGAAGRTDIPRPDPALDLSAQDPTVLMAMNLYAEARGEWVQHGDDALYGVGRVVMNRAISSSWPSTPAGVILQPAQFSWTAGGDANYEATLNPGNDAAWEACVRIARELLAGGGGDPVPGADHYHTNAISPNWADASKKVAQIGAHIFYDLVSDDNEAAGKNQRRSPEWTPAPPLADVRAAGSTATLRLGHTGPAVEELQRLLGLADVDGYYGADTDEAVRRFALDNGLGQGESAGHRIFSALEQQKAQRGRRGGAFRAI